MSVGSSEPIRIGIETPGAEEAARLADQLEAVRKRVAELDDQVQRGAPGWEMAAKEKALLAAEADRTTAALERLAKAAAKANAAAAKASAKTAARAAAPPPVPPPPPVDSGTYELADATLHELANGYVVVASAAGQYSAAELSAMHATTGTTQAVQASTVALAAQPNIWARAGSSADQASAATQRFASKLNQSTRRGSSGANMLAYKMGVLGATIDDLQYVGEMGLRPIINNLMMINPALGIAVIAFDQARKHIEELKAAGKGIAEYWGLDKVRDETDGIGKAWMDVAGAIGTATIAAAKFAAGVAEGFDAMSGGPENRMRATAKAFREGSDAESRERAGAAKKAIESMPRGQVLDMLVHERAKISPDLRDPGKKGDRARLEEQARIADILERAMKGNREALAEFENRTQGTTLGADYHRTLDAERSKGEVKHFAEQQRVREQAAAQHNDEVEQHRKDQARAFDQRTTEAARGFEGRTQDRLLKNMLRSDRDPRKLSADAIRARETNRIKDRLLSTGQESDPATALRMAQEIFAQNLEALGKKLREKVNAGDMSPEAAARALVAENAAKKAKEGEAKGDQAAKLAKEAIPAVAKQTQRRLMAGELQGGDPEAVAKALGAELKRTLEQEGLTAEDAGLAADRLIDEAKQKVEGDIAEARDNPKDPAERKSEVHSAVDFGKALLTAKTGQDAQEKSVRIQERMLEQLSRQRDLMEQQARNPPVPRLS